MKQLPLLKNGKDLISTIAFTLLALTLLADFSGGARAQNAPDLTTTNLNLIDKTSTY